MAQAEKTGLRPRRLTTRRLTYSALCLALAQVLPLLTGQIPQVGKMLCPMHLPVLLCGFLCGWPWGLAVGFIAPLLRSLLFGAPPIFPKAIGMAFELATYGAVSGLLYARLPRRLPWLYGELLAAMVCGRLVWGTARYVMAGLSGDSFPMAAFLAGAVTEALPGIVLQLVLLPGLVRVLTGAGLSANDP